MIGDKEYIKYKRDNIYLIVKSILAQLMIKTSRKARQLLKPRFLIIALLLKQKLTNINIT